jgi:hypothetical protein
MRARPQLCFAGALAISTYCARTSYDYNLLTAYPLLLVLFVDVARRNLRSVEAGWALLGLGILGVAGDRHLFLSGSYAQVHIGVQLAWLLLVAAYYGLYEPFGTRVRSPLRLDASPLQRL